MKFGRLVFSDQPDKYGEEIERLVLRLFDEKSEIVNVTVAAEFAPARDALIRLCDVEKCTVVFTTGAVGLGVRDVAPDALRETIDKELPGFGEIMRYYSYERVKLAAVSRATAGVRGQTLLINLPARPKALKFCLKLICEAMAEAIEQITGNRHVLFVDPIEIPLQKAIDYLLGKKKKSKT
jgi:molybdopterin adenylyltransferase